MSAYKVVPSGRKRPGDKRPARARVLAVCARMADEGLSLGKACIAEGIDKSTVLALARTDDEIRTLYSAAREQLVESKRDALAEEADDVVAHARRNGQRSGAYVSAFVAKANIVKWEAERLLGKVYGNRLDLNHSGSIDLAARLAKARERTS